MTSSNGCLFPIKNKNQKRQSRKYPEKLEDYFVGRSKPTLLLGMNIPELVRTVLSLLFPDSLSATSDLFSSDLAYRRRKTEIHIDGMYSISNSMMNVTNLNLQ